MPRVSILLTCYNHLAYLPACLESVWAQTFDDFEVIVLDDGSTDGTREWLTSGAPPSVLPGCIVPGETEGGVGGGDSGRPRPPLRIVFNERNLGTYGTLNVGLGLATGEFVAVLNDDDLWAPTKLEREIAMLDAHPEVGLVHTDGHFIDGDGRRTEGNPLGFAFPRTETGDVLLALIGANKIIASAVLVRRQCFDEVGVFDEAYFGSGDWQMWLRVAERWAVGYVDEPLTFYRVHGANASHKLERIWRDDERLREWLVERSPSYRGRYPDAELDAALAHNWACLGTVRTLNGDPAAGRRAYRESLRLAPGRWQSRLRMAATYLPAPLFRRLL